MREIPPARRAPRRKRRSGGCGGCIGRLLVFLVVFSLIGALGYRAFQSLGLKNRFLQAQYPIKYQSFVEKYAKEFSLDTALIYAIIRTESRFDPYAESTAGARGLMQLQTETARDCAKALRLSDFSPEDLFEPEINIRLGCCYFRQLMNRYNNDWKLSAAAYNGGPGNVERWLKDEAYTDQKGGLRDVPFPETRNYIVRIGEAYEKYRELYPPQN